MTRHTLEGNRAVALAALHSGVEVVAAYPITPSTGIPEALSEFYADGKLKEFVPVESEFGAASAILGACAGGARAFTATSSQGLLFMHEVLPNMSGMRLPVVMAVANRAVGAPLSIWNDSQDSVSERDSGWIQLYARSNQEAVDLIPISFKVAEQTNLPVMMCLDGFYLTHMTEPLDIPEADQISAFLPPFQNAFKLDSDKPLTMGAYTTPPFYEGFRKDLQADLIASEAVLEKAFAEYAQKIGRAYHCVESEDLADADVVFVGLGSMMSNARLAKETLRKEGKKAGWVFLRSLRPFPRETLRKLLAGKTVAVMEKDLTPGNPGGPIFLEVNEALTGTGAVVSGFTGGLGGREIGQADFLKLYDRVKNQNGKAVREWA